MEGFLREYLLRGDVVVDVGANIGTTTLVAAHAVGPQGQVYAFEPGPTTFEALVDNISLNAAVNVNAGQYVVGNETGEVAFSQSGADDQRRVTADNGVRVPQVRLDDLDIREPVALCKVDVEGYELQVLRGAERLLISTGCVVFECSAEHFRRYGYTPADLLDYLRSLSFTIYRRRGSELTPVNGDTRCEGREDLVALRDPMDASRRGLQVAMKHE